MAKRNPKLIEASAGAETSIPCVIYAAKSTVDKNASIPEQLDDCREMAEENGWTIIGEFWDENFTAYSGNRGPGLTAAIRMAKEAASPERWVMLVAQHTSRFARGDGAEPGAPKSTRGAVSRMGAVQRKGTAR